MTAPNPTQPAFHPAPDPQWLALHDEPALDPDLPIIDAHHHLFDRPERRYRIAEFRDDLTAGHRVIATVYLECSEGYRSTGPEALRPVGETEAVARVAEACAADPGFGVSVAAAIVAHADLAMGAAVDQVLEAHAAAAPGRFRGIRHSAAEDSDPAFARTGPRPPRARFDDPRFRAGFARLAQHGLVFDAWLYHPQLPELIDLTRAFPDTRIVLNHAGGPLGIGRYARDRDLHFQTWRESIRTLAREGQVVVKLGGLGMRLNGFGFHEAPRPPDSEALAHAWRPHVETCLEAFGASRCMFESNFPVDQVSCSYRTLWNAFKRLAAGCSPDERAALFHGTARSVYRIDA